MIKSLPLNTQQIADLETIRDLGPEKIESVIQHLSQIEPPPLNPDQLASIVDGILSESNKATENLVRVALSLNGVIRKTDLSAKNVTERVSNGLKQNSNWTEDGFLLWAKIEPLLEKLIYLPAIRLVSKALELSYEHSNLLQQARILTDIRPLYDDDANKVEGSVISYTLRIVYENAGKTQSLSLTLDESDIKELENQCIRGIKKGRLACDWVADKHIPTTISGESGNGKSE